MWRKVIQSALGNGIERDLHSSEQSTAEQITTALVHLGMALIQLAAVLLALLAWILILLSWFTDVLDGPILTAAVVVATVYWVCSVVTVEYRRRMRKTAAPTDTATSFVFPFSLTVESIRYFVIAAVMMFVALMSPQAYELAEYPLVFYGLPALILCLSTPLMRWGMQARHRQSTEAGPEIERLP